MESPYNRPIAANLIEHVLTDIERRRKDAFVFGFSREMSIYWALKQAGFLTEEAMVPDEI